jgi:dTDP-4-amino-4,6-dideoxygalactose transaminase
MRPEKRLPVAEELSDTAMMFLVHPTLSENDMRDDRVIQKHFFVVIPCKHSATKSLPRT